MTRILALDSATDACSVALFDDGKITSVFELAAKSHTQRLLPMVDEVLQTSGIALADLDAIAFGRGPGSFTGLRICLGVVQGLAFGADLPVIPVSTLAAMAAGYYREVADEEKKLPVLAALDARMDEVYWSVFVSEEGRLEPRGLVEEQVSAPLAVTQQSVVRELVQQFVAVGSGWHYPDLQTMAPSLVLEQHYPQAEDIARIAAEKFARHEQVSILEAEPVYLRDTVSWQKRQRIRSEHGGASE
jgi:tRNA threonylcarbamoyladenosine biosynthesis protein TsaB